MAFFPSEIRVDLESNRGIINYLDINGFDENFVDEIESLFKSFDEKDILFIQQNSNLKCFTISFEGKRVGVVNVAPKKKTLRVYFGASGDERNLLIKEIFDRNGIFNLKSFKIEFSKNKRDNRGQLYEPFAFYLDKKIFTTILRIWSKISKVL